MRKHEMKKSAEPHMYKNCACDAEEDKIVNCARNPVHEYLSLGEGGSMYTSKSRPDHVRGGSGKWDELVSCLWPHIL